MYQVVENKYVYEVTENKTAIVGNVKKIKIDNELTQINTTVNIPINYQTFDVEQQKYITDSSIYKDIEIYLNGSLSGTETILNGVGNIEFESAEAGIFEIRIENTTCEVIVE